VERVDNDHQYFAHVNGIINNNDGNNVVAIRKIDNVLANMRPRNRRMHNNRARDMYNNRKIVNNLPVKKIKNNNNFMHSSGSRKNWHR
jgi:hypothetical protein